MEITNRTLSLVKGQQSSGATPTGGGAPGQSRATATGDSVVLTDAATRLQAIEKSLASVPVVDPARVDRLRGVIESERYSVDFGQVAEKVVDFEEALNRARGPG